MKKKVYRERYGNITNHTEEKKEGIILTNTTKTKKKKSDK